jgi:hypothetical protein
MVLKSCTLALILALAEGPMAVAQTATCAPSDSFATHFLRIVREVVSPDDTTPDPLRSRLGISTVPDSEVVLVVADSVCAVAGTALDSLDRISPSTREVHVVRMGTTGYAVLDRRGVYVIYGIHIFGNTWVYKGTITLEG